MALQHFEGPVTKIFDCFVILSEILKNNPGPEKISPGQFFPKFDFVGFPVKIIRTLNFDERKQSANPNILYIVGKLSKNYIEDF